MTFEWKTKNINIQRYYKAVRRCVILNGDDGTRGSGYRAWQKFKKRWTIIVASVDETEKYSEMFEHLDLVGAGGMAWGITGKDILWWFVTDSRNPRIFMQNLPPGFHEVLHALYQQEVGTKHVKYLTGEPPEVSTIGQKGPAATVIVHDNWYGFKTSIRVWFLHSMWVPTRMPYIPIKKAKELYAI